jgi:3-phosphoshikimate 1-carboxyvinyltransferase
MATAIAALKAEGTTRIGEAQAIEKSYPDFFEDLARIGASIESHSHQSAFNRNS